MKWWRKALIASAGLAIVLAVIHGYMPGPVPVEIEQVSRSPLRVTVEAEGRTRLKDRYVISAPVTGYMKRIALKAGDSIDKGSQIVAIEPLSPSVLDERSRAAAEAGVKAAEAALRAAEENEKAARARAGLATSEKGRIEGLLQEGYATNDAVERARAGADAAEAALGSAGFAVDVAESELKAAQAALEYSASGGGSEPVELVTLRSPVKGRVLKLYRESSGVVAAGEMLVELGDPSALEVVADVLSADAVRIKPGTRVVFERWGGGTLEGRVRVVEPHGFTKISALGVEEQRVFVVSDITSPASQRERLGDGYRVEAEFVLWEGRDVLQVPASALFRTDGGWAVFVIEGGRAMKKKVEVGHRSGLRAEILSGLSGGETVIAHPDREVEDGRGVKPR